MTANLQQPQPAAISETMAAALDKWEEISREADERQIEFARQYGAIITPEIIQNGDELRAEMRAQAAQHIGRFEQDNSALTADELATIASAVSPGGAHNGGLLVRIIQHNVWHADPLLVAAAIYHNWHGGKAGFQFLPDPAEMDADEYCSEAFSLLEYLGEATDWNPRRILVGDDLAFYDALPDRFTVYRGCPGIDAERAGHGVCWTTSRAMAEWFARRGPGAPILVTARARKSDVMLANAAEAEIVLQPRKPRALKLRAWPDKRLDAAKDADMALVAALGTGHPS